MTTDTVKYAADMFQQGVKLSWYQFEIFKDLTKIFHGFLAFLVLAAVFFQRTLRGIVGFLQFGKADFGFFRIRTGAGFIVIIVVA